MGVQMQYGHNIVMRVYVNLDSRRLVNYHPKMNVLWAIYVDDLKMSGPSENLAKGWAPLRAKLEHSTRNRFRSVSGLCSIQGESQT